MAWKKIETYWLRYNTQGKMAQIGVKYTDGGLGSQPITHTFTLPGSEAVFLADLLRYEKPVYFDPNNGLISTGDEPVGEEESS